MQGSVAKSTHTGIPWLRRINHEVGERVHFWPFDGWEIPAGKSVFVEVYPSLFRKRDRQGNDAGSQYRSVIFYASEEQRSQAERVIRELDAEHIWPDPIVTEVLPATAFYHAEDYHQDYFRSNPNQPYCAFVVAPKARKFREKFAHKLKSSIAQQTL